MTRSGVNILLVGLLTVGLGGIGFFLPFLVRFDLAGVQAFNTGVLICWILGAALVIVGGVVAGLGRIATRR
jgi:hypothetical protein